MTEPTPPPAAQPSYAPPPPPKKKGLSPLAWVGIGCGALVLIGVIVVGVGMIWVGKKAKDFAGEFEANPAYAAAKMAVRMNPAVELVEADDETGTLTVRDKESGEVVTFNLEDIQEGRLEVFTEGGEETSVTFRGTGEGGFEVESEQGGTTSRMRFGADAGEIPEWVPVYPGTEPASNFISSTAEGTQGMFSFATDDSTDDVLAWYADQMEDLGIEPERSTFDVPGSRGGLVHGKGGGRELNATVADQGQGTQVTVTFSGKDE